MTHYNNIVLINAEWYTLLCLEDNKEYVSTLKNMETTEGLEVTEEELKHCSMAV